MTNPLFEYYERELEYMRRAGADFAQRFPKVAARLGIEPNKCDDPHVERLLEGFAFLAARLHLRLDDDFPEISEALLSVVAPQYIRPLPAMSIAEFAIDPDQGKQTGGKVLPAGTTLLSRSINGTPCKFRTCYDLTLWPLTVTSAQWTSPDRLRPAMRTPDAAGVVRMEVQCLSDVPLASLDLTSLRFFLNGSATLGSALYEVLANNTIRIVLRDLAPNSKKELIELPRSALRAVGFEEHEGVIPSSGRSFLGYRLLTEYFAFPEKFFFFELFGLEALRTSGFRSGFELLIFTSSFETTEWKQTLESGVSAQTFRLSCTPIVNLFSQTSEPILLDQRRHEYTIVPDARRRLETEVYSVDDVVVVTHGSPEPVRFEPYYSLRHSTSRAQRGAYWLARRRPTPWRKDRATDVHLSFVDMEARVTHPASDAVTVRLTCFNSDLPSLLTWGDAAGDFEIEGGGPFRAITALMKPTKVVQPPMSGALLWRLVSLLSLNYLSLVEGGGDALREILRLHNFAGSESNDQQIEGIAGVRSKPTYARVENEYGLNFARGRLVEVDLDENRFAGSSMFLFASVIERFLGMYVSINSFSQLVARSTRRRGVIRQWAPRSGWKTIL